MIPRKLFQRMTDLEEEYLNNQTMDNFKQSVNFQDSIRWPFAASQEQLDYWKEMNHEPGQ